MSCPHWVDQHHEVHLESSSCTRRNPQEQLQCCKFLASSCSMGNLDILRFSNKEKDADKCQTSSRGKRGRPPDGLLPHEVRRLCAAVCFTRKAFGNGLVKIWKTNELSTLAPQPPTPQPYLCLLLPNQAETINAQSLKKKSYSSQLVHPNNLFNGKSHRN